jgi:hypothetical protein
MGEEDRRQELRLAHRAGPRADHVGAVDVAALQDLQRREQLAACPGRAPAVEAERGQRVDGRRVAVVAAIVALDAPDGHHHGGRHAMTRGGHGRGLAHLGSFCRPCATRSALTATSR